MLNSVNGPRGREGGREGGMEGVQGALELHWGQVPTRIGELGHLPHDHLTSLVVCLCIGIL